MLKQEHSQIIDTANDPPNALRVMPPVESEKEKAAKVRAAIRSLLEQCAAVMNEAQKDGINVTFAMSRDAYGRWMPGSIDCVKPL
jgi:hypothetical protein